MFTLGCVYVNPSYTPFCATNIKAQGSGSNRYAVSDFSGFQETQERADGVAKNLYDSYLEKYNGTQTISNECKSRLKNVVCFAAFPLCNSQQTTQMLCPAVCTGTKNACPSDADDPSALCGGATGSCHTPVGSATSVSTSLWLTVSVAIIVIML